MKIGNSSNRPVSGQFGIAGPSANGQKGGASQAATGADHTRLSGLSTVLRDHAAAHQARLSALGAAVSAAAYHADASAVSESIVRYSTGLFSPSAS